MISIAEYVQLVAPQFNRRKGWDDEYDFEDARSSHGIVSCCCVGNSDSDDSATSPESFNIEEFYEVRRLLGEGASGETWLCVNKITRKNEAVKFIKRPIPRLALPSITHEVKIQADLGDGHINLVKAKGLILTSSHLCLVMEYASGGNLTNHVTMGAWSCEERNGLFLAEDEARYFIWQSIQAVHFLHSNHVAHRDLKLDNIVCDFGFAKSWNEEAHMKTQVGTPVYMCPQLIKCSDGIPYDASKADLWACGVLLCVMMLGLFPFDHVEHPDPNESAAKHEVLRYQVQCSWREHTRVAEAARKLSMECRDLLDKIFELDERRRISLADSPFNFNFNVPPVAAQSPFNFKFNFNVPPVAAQSPFNFDFNFNVPPVAAQSPFNFDFNFNVPPVAAQSPFNFDFNFTVPPVAAQSPFNFKFNFNVPPVAAQSPFNFDFNFNVPTVAAQSPFNFDFNFNVPPVAAQSPFNFDFNFNVPPVAAQSPFNFDFNFNVPPVAAQSPFPEEIECLIIWNVLQLERPCTVQNIQIGKMVALSVKLIRKVFQ
eukprot:gene10463-8422_t